MLNRELLSDAKSKYDLGNYNDALREYYLCLKEQENGAFAPGEAGLVYHMLGNCLVKMRNFSDATKAYAKALEDTNYENANAVRSNYGLALSSIGQYQEAIEQFETVLKDPTYKTPYKTYSGLGNVYMKMGDFAAAGTAFRNAAVDESNPTPVKALLNLGVCFMGLNRPNDAIETYKAIFDFNPDKTTLNKTYANMGQAYVANGQMKEAADCFEKAIADGTYVLSDAASADYLRALTPHTAPDDSGIDILSSDLDYSGFADRPVDTSYPSAIDEQELEKDRTRIVDNSTLGAGIPSADDTGFFTLPDEDNEKKRAEFNMMIEEGSKKSRRRHKVVLVVVLVIIVALAACGFLYWRGYGIPSQETTIETLFAQNAAGESVYDCWVGASSDEDRAKIDSSMRAVAKTNRITIDSISQSTLDSVALVSATLPQGGTVHYNVSLARDFSNFLNWFGWKVNGIDLAFASTQNKTSTQSTSLSGSTDNADVAVDVPDSSASQAAGGDGSNGSAAAGTESEVGEEVSTGAPADASAAA